MQVFTAKSVIIGVVSGALVAAALGQLLGASWGLATLNGLAAGASALALSIVVGDGRFGMINVRRRPGVRLLASVVMILPAFLAGGVIGVELARADGFALSTLLLLTAFASHVLGGVLATPDYIDDAGR